MAAASARGTPAPRESLRRLLVSLAVGAVAAAGLLLAGLPWFALPGGWCAASAVFLVWVWCTIAPMSPDATRTHALREDDSRTGAHVTLLLAAVSSLGAHVVILAVAADATSPERELLSGAGLATVVLSWAVVHTLYTLRYARAFHLAGGGIDFNQEADPDYLDFAYVAFTIGMTYALGRAGIPEMLKAGYDRRVAVGTVIIAAFAPPLTELAFKFGPAEYFSLMVLGLIGAVVLASGSLVKAIAMILMGLLLGQINTDVISGVPRYSFDIPELTDGIGFVVIAMGVFGFGEIIFKEK